MRHAMRAGSRLALCLAVALAAGCREAQQGGTETPAARAPAVEAAPPAAAAFQVSRIQLGKAIGDDLRIREAASEFAAGDTVYAAVDTEGSAPSVKITARWTYEDGQLVDESTKTIAPSGPATTEFHIAKPGGLPAGTYRLEVSVDGKSVGTQEFEVQP